MTVVDRVLVPSCLPRVLDTLIRSREGRTIRAVMCPSGGLARTLLAEGLPASIQILALLDSNPALQGTHQEGLEVLPSAELARLQPEMVLVASTRFHEEIAKELLPLCQERGIQVVDLCQGLGPLGTLGDEAWRLGLELCELEPGLLSITHPGLPRRRILYRREAGSNTLWMLQDFDHYFSGVAPDRITEEELLVDLSRPAYHTLLPSGLRLFYPSMLEHEDIIRTYMDFACLEPGAQVLDLGAYAGDSTAFFSLAVGPTGRVLAVEADPMNLAALRRNVAELGLSNVVIEGSALLDLDGAVTFQAEGSIGSGIAETSDTHGFELEVPALTLPTLIARHAVDRVDFIKMDIEGAEVRVLEANRDLLQCLRPRMIIESHPCQGVSNLERILQILRSLGCQVEVCGDLVRAWWES